ncbi:MAG TPA: type II toxin-antitoxin system death-on-curing family toxin [Herpetosiphonaceae bacterium]
MSDDVLPLQSLKLTEIFLIHELLIETFGGMRGVTEHGFGKLEAAVAAPDVSMFGEDLYVGLPAKATALFFRLVRAHGFSDGNKRVALVALIVYLERNGMRLHADDDAVYDFTMAAATDATQEQVAAWIEARCVAYAD